MAVLENIETLQTRARRDVFTWLENIIERSQANGGVTIVEQEDEPAAVGQRRPGLDDHLVFVRYECAALPTVDCRCHVGCFIPVHIVLSFSMLSKLSHTQRASPYAPVVRCSVQHPSE